MKYLVFLEGGYSSKINFLDHLRRIQIRRDNGQSLFILSIIIFYKSIKNIKRIIKEFNQK